MSTTTVSQSCESNTPSKTFAFRPSKLSEATDKIWKKDTTAVESKTGTQLNLVEKPTFSTQSSSDAAKAIEKKSSAPTFVFGRNIKDRVIVKEDDEKIEKKKNNDEETSVDVDGFKAVAKQDEESSKQSTSHENGATSSLAESAKEYEKSKNESSKVKLTENIDVKTGEENEKNIMHVSCKLHVFDHAKQSWEERGHAILRLNETNASYTEAGAEQVRIVVRLQGSLKLVVNSRIFAEMLIERISPKRLKMSAIDPTDKSIILYLITANQNEIEKMEDQVKFRLLDMKQNVAEEEVEREESKKRKPTDDEVGKVQNVDKKNKTV